MKFSRAVTLLSFVASVCVLTTSHASVASNQSPQTKVAPAMVILHVRVTDPQDKPVRDVPQTSFQVTEDGIPQKIEFFTNEEVPLTYGLALDCSGSLRSQFPQVLQAAANIVNANKPEDETLVMSFISSDRIQMVQTLTSDKRLLFGALESLYIEGGQTAVIDAIYVGANYLAQQKAQPGKVRRKALILVTDGEDRASYYKQEQLFQLLGSTDTQMFIIGLTKDLQGKSRERAIVLLKQLATETGGRTYFPSSTAGIPFISNQIIDDIRKQYVIGYTPSGGDPAKAFHKVQVSIIGDPDKEKRAAITRVGYQARN